MSVAAATERRAKTEARRRGIKADGEDGGLSRLDDAHGLADDCELVGVEPGKCHKSVCARRQRHGVEEVLRT